MDCGKSGLSILRIDGGMVANDRTKRALANQLSAPVDRPTVTGTAVAKTTVTGTAVAKTAVAGIACLAGLAAILSPKPADFAQQSALEKRFEPKIQAFRQIIFMRGGDAP
jgi:glycerol kinase